MNSFSYLYFDMRRNYYINIWEVGKLSLRNIIYQLFGLVVGC